MLMGVAALLAMIATLGSVKLLVVLYSINVFITFCLSQAGMVKHWWSTRNNGWEKKIFVSASALTVCGFILISMVVLKFRDGGWVTLVITGSLIALAVIIKRHYKETLQQLRRLDDLIKAASMEIETAPTPPKIDFDPQSKTAVLLVNGYNGLGLHTLFNVIRFFGKTFKNFVFVEIGVIDAGNFKGNEQIENLQEKIHKDITKYIRFMNHQGYYANGLSFIGLEVIQEMEKRSEEILAKYPNAVFFGGQLVFSRETFMNRWLHNYTVFALQRMFYHKSVPFVILPIRV
jgi:K+ transporter